MHLGPGLAAYYSQAEHFAHWTQVFADLYSGAFLQCTIVFLCGFSALGPGLIGLFLAGKGVMLGLCAAGVYSNGGAHGLVVYWLLTCLSDLILLVLLLWLALSAQAPWGNAAARFARSGAAHAAGTSFNAATFGSQLSGGVANWRGGVPGRGRISSSLRRSPPLNGAAYSHAGTGRCLHGLLQLFFD